jgi:hypothetical protein
MGRTERDWPFDDPPNTASYTTANVLERGFPILLVTHDADDGAWQFLCGETNKTEDGRLIGLDCALTLDPSVGELADLPLGWRAWRDSPTDPWQREPRPARDTE